MAAEYAGRLVGRDYVVRPVSLSTARRLVEMHHYAKGGSNTATHVHGLFRAGATDESECLGVAWWLPPTKVAALSCYPENWQGVLGLSRLVLVPGVPKNAATFLLAHSRKAIDRVRWPCLVTYADTWQGHTGGIYRADNWHYVGLTRPSRVYQINGRMVARKAGSRTRTHSEMLALGARLVGAFAKHKFVHIERRRRANRP